MHIDNKKPKILFVDIETAPILAYTWGYYEQNLLSVKEDSYILCFAYKWYGDKGVRSSSRAVKGSDKVVVSELWALFNDADIIIAHNGDAFDIKKANARFVKHGLPPPAPYLTIDTMKEAGKYVNIGTRKLNELCRAFGIGTKEETGGKDLWFKCMDGDAKAWKKMELYCRRDVELLEKLYLLLRPWMRTHPKMYNNPECPKCGKKTLQKRGFERMRAGTVYQRYQCTSCGGWSRNNKREPIK